MGFDIPKAILRNQGRTYKFFSVTSPIFYWLLRSHPDSVRQGTTQGMRNRRNVSFRLKAWWGGTSLKLATTPYICPLCSGSLMGRMSKFFGVTYSASSLYSSLIWKIWLHYLAKSTNSMLFSILLFINSHFLIGSISGRMPMKWSLRILWGAQLTNGKLKHLFHTKWWSMSV